MGRSDVQVTWEPESVIPKSVIDEFESGLHVQTMADTTSLYKQHSTTIVKQNSKEPPSKKARRIPAGGNTGLEN